MKNPILIVGSPAKYPDLRYVTGLFSFDPVVFLRARPRQYLIVSPLDFGHVRRTVKDMEVLSFSDFPVAKNSKTPASDRIIGLLKKKNIRSVTVPFYFPVGLAKQLAGKGVKVSVADGNVFPEREIKTAKEIKYIIFAQKAATKAMEAAVLMIAGARIARDRSLKIGHKPLTSEAVRARIDNTARDFDCVCYGTIVAGGAQAANPHETGWGTLKADEPIVIDIFPQHIKSGYWGDLTRTVVRGTPSPEIQKMYSAVRDAQRTAILKIKAGVPAGKIHNTAVNLFKERGFFTGAKNGKQVGFIHGIGHGIGLEIHENPSVRPVETKLKEGNVITIEPGLYYHNRGGIRIEDVVLVTRTGGRILAPYYYPFIIT
ncbi:MAG: Xaa-Pro peptidase family protein [Kiritimatiellia bacterium]|nr:Xaa-Pro peptidase family protein [Kiritimatiellia bacterium]